VARVWITAGTEADLLDYTPFDGMNLVGAITG
jgi:hypothetical protein